jgi:hypothetical protein
VGLQPIPGAAMMGRFAEWVADMIGAAPKRPVTRLAEDRVLEIAKAAVAKRDEPPTTPPSLIVRDVISTDEGVVWIIDTGTRGSGVSVRVSDDDGRVIEVRRRVSR